MDHGLFQADAEMNRRMHAAGFTPAQVQLVYDLAAERLVPLVEEMAAEFEPTARSSGWSPISAARRRWREVSRQMLAWARRNLPAEAVEGLSDLVRRGHGAPTA